MSNLQYTNPTDRDALVRISHLVHMAFTLLQKRAELSEIDPLHELTAEAHYVSACELLTAAVNDFRGYYDARYDGADYAMYILCGIGAAVEYDRTNMAAINVLYQMFYHQMGCITPR